MSSTADLAIDYIKSHKKELCKKFADPTIYTPVQNPVAYFMAGSPGAGKTETSIKFIKELEGNEPSRKIVRIDADEIRDWIPYYDHKNASEIQHGAGLGVSKLLDHVIDHKLDFLLDGTFSEYKKSRFNIDRCIKHKRKVAILFLYLEPLTAWEYTRKREALEGRHIPKDYFIDSFLKARENVNLIKKEFVNTVELNVFIKKPDQSLDKSPFKVNNVDSYLKKLYTRRELERLIEKAKI